MENKQIIREFVKFLIDHADKDNKIQTSELPDLVKEFNESQNSDVLPTQTTLKYKTK